MPVGAPQRLTIQTSATRGSGRAGTGHNLVILWDERMAGIGSIGEGYSKLTSHIGPRLNPRLFAYQHGKSACLPPSVRAGRNQAFAAAAALRSLLAATSAALDNSDAYSLPN